MGFSLSAKAAISPLPLSPRSGDGLFRSGSPLNAGQLVQALVPDC